MPEARAIEVVGARVHNLKGIDVSIPRNKLTIITGPSGSGKSSLAFDTVYVEGQRRYIESLSSYARQFLGQFSPPDVESITGLSPSIAINQKTTSSNPRSTVGTVTEIYDYMRILFAKAGTLRCPEAGDEVAKSTVPSIAREVMAAPAGARAMVAAPLPRGPLKDLRAALAKFRAEGFARARVDGSVAMIDAASPGKNSAVELVVDRIVVKKGVEARLADSVERALKIGGGDVVLVIDGKEMFRSERNVSPKSRIVYPDLEPRLFSFNSPLGACGRCNGLGFSKAFVPGKVVTDKSLSIPDGGIAPLSQNRFLFKMARCMARQEGVDLDLPVGRLPKGFLRKLFHGSKETYRYSFRSRRSSFVFSKCFPGILAWLERKHNETSSERVRASLERHMETKDCGACGGRRLNPVALATRIGGRGIMDVCDLSIREARDFIRELDLDDGRRAVADKVLREIGNRLGFLVDVGLDYLSLNRPSSTLSGGESQRIRLASQIGSRLSGVLYVLDEPSIGLHQKDNLKLIGTLKSLRDLGNTVVVVEHDEETMRASDHIIDLGPGAGHRGGEVVVDGPLKGILRSRRSVTAGYLGGRRSIPVPAKPRPPRGFVTVRGARGNNLKGVDVAVPLGVVTCVTGVSGSGKSTLVHDVLIPAATRPDDADDAVFDSDRPWDAVEGDVVRSVIHLDQKPIGRTPRSNPATYSGVFAPIRELFASVPDSVVKGHGPGRFSFNVKGGRCDECEGDGVKRIEMHFLPDVHVTCGECRGARYNRETLSVLYKGRNIAEVLDMEVSEARAFFEHHPRIRRILDTMESVGLGYMRLGQSATTLSGGEAQRLKLSRELAKRTLGDCLYVLDEPTTGLHFEDVRVLLAALDGLVAQGGTVVVIEHNLDVIKTADHVIDLGPGGGDRGGRVVAVGPPSAVARAPGSHTGKFLRKVLK